MAAVDGANRFAFLNEDDAATGDVTAPKPKPAVAAPRAAPVQQRAQAPAARSAPQGQRAPREQGQRPPRQFRAPREQGDFEQRPEGERQGGDRPRGERRNGAGRPHHEGGRPPKREFDRHSGSDKTGVKSEEKKGLKYNWGREDTRAPRRDFNRSRSENAENAEAAPAAAAAEGETPAAAEGAEAAPAAEAEAAKEPVEEGPKELTLEEYRKQQAASATKFALPKARVAGENVDNSQWKNTTTYARKDEDANHPFAHKEAAPAAAASTSEKKAPKKEHVLINLTFPEIQRPDRADRGDRPDRAPRGDRPDRAPRGDRPPRDGAAPRNAPRGNSSSSGSRQKAFDVNDQSAFPSLGGK
ncbi:hypothetical protein CAOG_00522 [Capsaspora owczarzaki ATCC 30864]|uniref:Hyaluronan/mRNA-binding protein domain-containing protein n=1 Tax=Capsaspora owczarzaki (strain ATCC 30864) TaxID=595528 RepID=A0A0D2WH96_CAPO3|nr:hypothetical protein CAOG_00522 [Capsaspora owczarzaki ATCC 30864]KJE88955.1 hypothetical protein CAOG_000522 [Capsaspora owczarzaki ATCC 30864]|eukprot:XP_004365393.2 hypothetical protein CAOG_00522 [Capsaspora owczarzaki ATCC 30864]